VAVALAAWRQHRASVSRPPGADGSERVLFVGSSALAGEVAREIDARADARWRVLGLVANRRSGQHFGLGPWLGGLEELGEIVAATCPTRIVLGPANRRRRAAEHILLDARLAGILVEDAAETLEELTGKLPIERLTSKTLVLGQGFRHPDTAPNDLLQDLTRTYSCLTALLGLCAAAPLFLAIALAIKLDSRGPVLFVQERIGMGGRPFRLFKFRTMRETSRRSSEWVSDNSDRITRVGRWLRRFRLDELPQLINVLVGDMNLVGPRPHPASNGPLFLARIPHYRLRFSVRPGITGWAQVRYGYANGLDEETEKMRYDLYYIKHRSLWLDVVIVLRTVRTLVLDSRNHEQAHHAPARTLFPSRWTGTPHGAVVRS
jgi:exopolysaccharide biosynthesis polyprenyl glycosylphosphotransferase